MQPEYKGSFLNRLKTVRGHLDGVIAMVEAEEYCIDLMKQISALPSSLERANRLVLLNHLETCFSDAVSDGRGQAALAEFLEALKFNSALTGTEISPALAASTSGASAAVAPPPTS